jgi:hypothetical protein
MNDGSSLYQASASRPANVASTTQTLKAGLWSRFGDPQHPAEWDGRIYGGGKLSQRFWEYFKAIELLDLGSRSVVLDIGGGSPTTGAGFFASLLSTAIAKVVVLDPQIPREATPPPNITFIREPANYDTLRELFSRHPEITHVASISVFEHIEAGVRQGIVRAINESFTGEMFVSTFEYHPRRVYFDHQLTARSVSALFSPLTNYFLDEFVSSPVLCENAFDDKWVPRLGRSRGLNTRLFSGANIPLWHPVAARFLRQPHPRPHPAPGSTP